MYKSVECAVCPPEAKRNTGLTASGGISAAAERLFTSHFWIFFRVFDFYHRMSAPEDALLVMALDDFSSFLESSVVS